MSDPTPSTIAASTTWPRPGARLEKPQNAGYEKERAATVVGDEVERRRGRLALASDGVERAGERGLRSCPAAVQAPSAPGR
jgi:hypothetical protein